HHNLGNLAAFDNARSSKALESGIVDLCRIVDEEAQASDTTLDALHVFLATQSYQHIASQDIITILWFFCSSGCRCPVFCGLHTRPTLALWKNPVRTQSRRCFPTSRRCQVETDDEEAKDEVVQDAVDKSNDKQQQRIGSVRLRE